MWLEEEQTGDQGFYANPYESFIKRHLKNSYGYFTGRNQNYRNGFQQYNEWEKTFAFDEGSSSSEECDLDSDDEKSAIGTEKQTVKGATMDSDEETGTESGSDSESGSEYGSESGSGSELDAESQKELRRRNNSVLPKEWKSSEKGGRVVANKESSKDKKHINIESKQDKTRDILQPSKPSQAQTKKNYIAKSSSDSETSNDDDNDSGTAGEDNMENSSTSVSTNVGDKAKSKKSGQEENKDSEDDGSSGSKSESLEKSDEDDEESENEESDNQRSDMSCIKKPKRAPKDKSDTSLNNSDDEKEEDKEEEIEDGSESAKSSTLSVKKKYSSKQVEEEQESLVSNPDEVSEEIDKDDFDQEYTSAGSAFEEGSNKRNRKSINKMKKIHKNSSSSSSISDNQEVKSEQEDEGSDSDPSEQDDSSKRLYRSSNSSDEDDVKSCRESDESSMGKSVKKRDKNEGHPEMIDDVVVNDHEEDENMTMEEGKYEKGEETSELEFSADDNEEASDQDILDKDSTEDHISRSHSQSDTVSENSRSSAYNIKVPEEKAKRTMILTPDMRLKSDKSILRNYDSALKTKDPKYGSQNGPDFKGVITEHCLPESDRTLLKVMSSSPSSVQETESGIVLESMTGTKPKCNSAPVLRGTHLSKAEMTSSSSESELSDESYLLQNFTSSSDSESSNNGTQSGSEGSSKDKKKEDTSKTYPPPVEKPWKYKRHSHPVMEHVQMYALFPDHILEDSLALQQESEHDPVSYEDNRQEDIRTTQVVYSCESGRMVPRLREPRNLYALNKELGPQQAARWPSEIQVLKDRISHFYYVPPEPEPYYKPTGMERTPMCRGEAGGGKVIFEYDPKLRCFMRSCVGGSRNGTSKCAVELESENDTTLIFESRFESGNLAKAVKVGDYEYELWLRYDLYTDKHTQWFYFSFSNTRSNVQYRFTIVNLLKPDSLYNNGMRPLMYSEKEANLKKVGWIRGGQDIKYYRNNLRYATSKGEKSYFSLTWTAVLVHENDTVYWAHCYPYTYTDLQDYLMELQNDPAKSRICKQRILCRSLAGNLVYILTISSPSQNLEDMKHKKAVVITSRVHPGESNSSWMMKGFLDYLTGNSADAKLLRDTFIFKIIPMLNPDGVIVGNYRCSLAGRDLNRQYKSMLKYAYPCVVHTRNMIRKLLQERDIIVYCDLHGHSRRQNVFIYGCEQRFGSNRRLHERIFPCMLHKNAPDKFSFDSCKFKVQKIKEGTGRVVMWNMGIMNSYTMEATFCGSSLGRKKGFHFSVADFEAMGYHFCDTLLDYCDPDNTKYAKILENLENRMKMAILAKLGRDSANDIKLDDIQLSDYNFEDVESSDMGSNSSDSDGPPIHMQYQAERMKKKKKKLKSRKDRDKGRLSGAEESKKPVAAPQTEEKSSKSNSEQVSKQSKVGSQPLRYSTLSGKRPRSNDERTGSGIPIFVQERFEERQQKKQQDYLEALTSTYVQYGFPINKDPGSLPYKALSSPAVEEQSVVHFRYSGSESGGQQPIPLGMEGLCAHHGQILTAHLAGGASLGRQGSLGSAQIQSRGYTTSFPGDSAFKIWKLVSRRQVESPELTPVMDGLTTLTPLDEFVRSQIIPSQSISPLERRPPSKPHLLEVSAAQQRQQDTFREAGSMQDHANIISRTQEHKSGSSGKNQYPRTQVPNATAVGYKVSTSPSIFAQPMSLQGQATADYLPAQAESFGGRHVQSSHSQHHNQGGRKSRCGMRDDDEEENDGTLKPHTLSSSLFNDLDSNLTTRPPRIKPAHTSQEMADAVAGIRKLQQSLQQHSHATVASATGNYIHQLIKETGEDIQDLTDEIQEKIENKLQELREVQHHQVSAAAPYKTEKTLMRTKAEGQRINIQGAGDKSIAADLKQQTILASSQHASKPGKRPSIQTLKQEELVETFSILPPQPGESRKREGSAHSSCSRDDFVPLPGIEAGEMMPRVKSARSCRQVVEAIPTKISLMICSDHKDGGDNTSKAQQFLPLYRSVRAPFFRNYTRRK